MTNEEQLLHQQQQLEALSIIESLRKALVELQLVTSFRTMHLTFNNLEITVRTLNTNLHSPENGNLFRGRTKDPGL
jgi:hypothetical protein